MLKDGFKAKGRVGIVLRDKDGNVKEERDVTNMVVTEGVNYIAARMAGTTQNVMTTMKLGKNGDDPVVGDTGVKDHATGETVTGNNFGTSVSGAVVTYTATFAAIGSGGTVGIKEAAITNDDTSDKCLCRVKFDVVNKGEDDSMSVTWTVTISDV